MQFRISGPIFDLQTVAVGSAIREVKRLRKIYGKGRWRKVKGVAVVTLPDGKRCKAEIHWYEAHGIGKKEIKLKRLLENDDET